MNRFKEYSRRWFPKGSFLSSAITLMAGSSFAQGLNILVIPILTRLYSPADFGAYAVYASLVGVLSVVVCWRYELAIVLPKKEEDAASLLALSTIISLGMSLLTLIIVLLFRKTIATLLKTPVLKHWLWLLPLSLFAAGLFQAYNYWCTRKKMFKRLARRQMTQSVITGGAQILSALIATPGAGGLVGGMLTGQLIATGHLAYKVQKEDEDILKKGRIKKNIFSSAKEYRSFPKFSMITGFLNATSQKLPSFLFPVFFNSFILGQFSLAAKAFTAPMGIVSQAIAQALYPRASEYHRAGNGLRRFIHRSYLLLAAIAAIPFVILFIFAPVIFGTIFGAEWRIAGTYLRYILPWLMLMFIVSPSTYVFAILDKLDVNLIFEIVLLFFRTLAIVCGAKLLKNPEGAIALYGLVGVFANLYLAFKIDRLMLEDEKIRC